MLIAADAERLDQAVELFEDAVDEDVPTASSLNDLGAAYLLRAGARNRPSDLVGALEALDRALDLAPRMAEARFNRALALEGLTLGEDARREWSAYSTGDPDSAEASTARRHAASLRRSGDSSLVPTTSSSCPPAASEVEPTRIREEAERRLGCWARLLEDGRPAEAAAVLAGVSALASEHRRLTADALLGDTVAAIESRRVGAEDSLQPLVRGHALFASARGDAPYASCAPGLLANSESALTAGGSPFVAWARIDRAVCAYFDKDFRLAEDLLSDARRLAVGKSYPSLRARTSWLLGLVRMVQGRFSEAAALYDDAISLFTALGEPHHRVYVTSLRAKSLEFMGAMDEAWEARYSALRDRGQLDLERQFTVVQEAHQALYRQGRPQQALAFLTEQLRTTRLADGAALGTDILVFTLFDRARVLGEIGRHAEALADLAEADAAWVRLATDNESRRRLRLELDVERLRNLPVSQGLIAAVDSAKSYFSRSEASQGDQIEVLKLWRVRAETHLSLKRPAEAERDLERAIGEIERQRLEVLAPEHRAHFLARAREVYDAMIRLQLDVHRRPLAALAYLEKATNRLLLDDQLPSGRARRSEATITAEGVKALLPAGGCLVRWGHVPGRLLIWVFQENDWRFLERPMTARGLDKAIERFTSGKGEASEAREVAGVSLSRLLLPAELCALEGESELLLVPDDLVGRVPFEALPIPEGRGGLLGDYSISYSASLSHLLDRGTDEVVTTPLSAGPVLIVADPELDPSRFPHLPPLPEARRSAERLARLYDRATVLVGRAATRSAVREGLRDARVFHFEGHAVLDPQVPHLSGIALAPDPREPGADTLLTAGDLDRYSLASLELVILAACDTAPRELSRTTELGGLSLAFLSRGARSVLATTSTVGDRAAATFVEELHKRLLAGERLTAATRAARRRAFAVHARPTGVPDASLFRLYR